MPRKSRKYGRYDFFVMSRKLLCSGFLTKELCSRSDGSAIPKKYFLYHSFKIGGK